MSRAGRQGCRSASSKLQPTLLPFTARLRLSQLYEASGKGDAEEVRRLLGLGAPVDWAKPEDGWYVSGPPAPLEAVRQLWKLQPKCICLYRYVISRLVVDLALIPAMEQKVSGSAAGGGGDRGRRRLRLQRLAAFVAAFT